MKIEADLIVEGAGQLLTLFAGENANTAEDKLGLVPDGPYFQALPTSPWQRRIWRGRNGPFHLLEGD